MADAYMGWTLDYAKRMIPLLEPFNLRWLEEPVIPDDIHGYAELKARGSIPIAGGEHEFTHLRFPRTARGASGGLHPVRHQPRGRPHAGAKDRGAGGGAFGAGDSARGQMHNYHVVMASLNSPMAEYFPPVDVEVGNELFWYVFKGEPVAKNGFM